MFRLMLVAGACLALGASAAVAQDQEAVKKGQALTVKNRCAMCHVIAGKGSKIAKSLDGASSRLDVAALKRILEDPQKELPPGKLKMPKVAWAPGDIDAVIAYLQTLK